MPPSGMLIIPGVRAEVTFYKGLLDKLGLQFDALQMGKYKGAAEPLTRNEMSKPLRESFEALVDDIYDDLVATIAADRHLKDYQVKTLVGPGPVHRRRRQEGRPDRRRALRRPVRRTRSRRSSRPKTSTIVTNYKKKKIDTDFSGFSGMMKLMELFMGGKPSEAAGQEAEDRRGLRRRPDHGGQEPAATCSASRPIGSTTIVAALRKAADDPKVAAIVLRIDSPGGSATASDLIWRETVRITEAAHRQHGRRGRQRRLLHRHGRQEDLRRPRHADRLDRRDRRQAGDPRTVRQARPEHRGDQPRGQQRLALVDPAVHARGAEGLDRAAGRDLPPVRRQGRRGPQDALRASWKSWPKAASTPAGWPRSSAWSTSWARWTTPSPPPRRPPG